MVTLKEEKAFAFAPHEVFLFSTCSFCFNNQTRVFKCSACKTVSYCCKNCQKSDWIDHKNECRLLQSWNKSHSSLPTAHVRVASRILLMSEERRSKVAFNGRTWDSIAFNLKDIKTDASRADLLMDAENLIKYSDPIKKVSLEKLTNVLGKVNNRTALNVSDWTSKNCLGASVYLGLSVHRHHSCLPDAYWVHEGTKCIFRAYDLNTVYSSELTVSFVKNDPFTEFHCLRKEKLKKMDLTECHCALCTNDNHIINRMGESCHVTCCEDGAGILDEFGNGPYKCNKCGTASAITQNQVKNMHSTLDTLIAKNKATHLLRPDGEKIFANAVDSLNSSKKLLSPFNYRVLDLTDQVIGWSILSYPNLSFELQEAMVPAFEYYLPKAHPRRAAHLRMIAVWMNHFGVLTDATSKAYSASVCCYGEDHDLTKNIKKFSKK